jgi:hypothetical protein
MDVPLVSSFGEASFFIGAWTWSGAVSIFGVERSHNAGSLCL